MELQETTRCFCDVTSVEVLVNKVTIGGGEGGGGGGELHSV
jgi:hypothetical protein